MSHYKNNYILDVGCGVGATACIIATKVGCRVIGVDIMEKMVERFQGKSIPRKVTDRVEFRVADAQDLPFEDNLFDAVITESVTAFPADKQKAVNEYARLVKPGGYVGLNETTWLKAPPPPEVVAWAAQDVGASVKPLTPAAWTELMVAAGLREIVTKTYAINTQDEAERYSTALWLGRIACNYGQDAFPVCQKPCLPEICPRSAPGRGYS